MNLPADIARCYGERDDTTRYYPYMSAEPIRGRCVYRIEEKDHA